MTKTIFITGGSRGIGEALVRLAAGKYNVAFTYLKNEERANAIVDELAEFGGVLAIKCDVRDRNSVLSAIEAAKKRFGKIDILVNNSGVSADKLLIDMTAEEWRDCFSVNVDGVF
ncbi:MAG: SDR family NAD(P)-dependent oxidoreductase, partial [Clostridia bacterium]|nr:SDR family NAD(P)-dependent oxidoreductase [Clostridia bacterium]